MKSYKQYSDIVDKNDGIDFFTLSAKERNADRAGYDAKADQADAQGKADTENFLSVARDFKHPGHEVAARAYKNKYASDPKAALEDFTAKAMKSAGAKRVQYSNSDYENSTLTSYKKTNDNGNVQTCAYTIANSDDAAVLDKFRSTLKMKWKAAGYKDDDTDIADFWSNHSLSTGSPAPSVASPSGGSKAAY